MTRIVDKAKLHRTLRKLLALADRGYKGERGNARTKLEGLLKKHSMKLADITDEATETCWFKHKGGLYRKLLFQIIVTVTDSDETPTWKNSRRRQQLGVELTKAQMIEVEMRYAMYSKDLEEGLNNFYTAFVHKNYIFPESLEPGDCSDEEDKERMAKIANMMLGIDKTHILKQLKKGD